MTRPALIVFLGIAFASGVAFGQEASSFHRIDAKSPDGLCELFRYDGATMPLVSAHRGGALPGYPENCIATFEHTLRHAFSILEIDLQFTKDRQIVLQHDATLDRTTSGTGRVADRTLQELKKLRLKDKDGNVTEYGMPTLDEALRWARGKTVVILDKKDVPVEVCVRKIQEHHAQSYAMVMAYSFQDIQTCHQLAPDIMMEVMIGNDERFRAFEQTGVPWNRIIAFVGHEPPEDRQLIEKIHAKGACCMAGTSRNLDRQLRVSVHTPGSGSFFGGNSRPLAETSMPRNVPDPLSLQAKQGTSRERLQRRGAGDEELAALARQYRSRLDFGVDVIETDLPIQVGRLLYDPPAIPASKSRFFLMPGDSHVVE